MMRAPHVHPCTHSLTVIFHIEEYDYVSVNVIHPHAQSSTHQVLGATTQRDTRDWMVAKPLISIYVYIYDYKSGAQTP